MTTVDSVPQKTDWLSTFLNADALLTYTEWGGEVLKKQTCGKVRWAGAAPAGFDPDVFRPVKDKRAHRERVGMDPDCLVVGMVARNQARKLFPDLMSAFRRFLDRAPHEIAKKTFLYLHTGWPDLGWDVPSLLKEYGLCSRVVMSYLCRSCGTVFPSFFSGHRTACRACGGHESAPVSFSAGTTPDQLAAVYNLFDTYVQYANCEGLGMPVVEAAACGVPVMAVDYSAMSEVVRNVSGAPLKVLGLNRDPTSNVLRAVPDQNDLVEKLISFLTLPQQVRAGKGRAARQGALAHYSYDRAAELWMKVIDGLPPAKPWDAPPVGDVEPRLPPEGLSDEDFVRFAFNELGREDLADSHIGRTLLRNLEWRRGDRESTLNTVWQLVAKKNFWESRRVEK
jgi:glycosyltransferase involved in cell wall biosynthesis